MRGLLAADGICYWRYDPDGVAIPVGCSPANWISDGFLMSRPEGQSWQVEYGDAAVARLPFVLRARLDRRPAAMLTAPCGSDGGFFAIWYRVEALPGNQSELTELAKAAYCRLLELAEQADLAVEGHLQLRSLLAALPQGVIVVPRHSRRGFVNAPAAVWLDLAPGEVEVGTLASALERFAAGAANQPEVHSVIRPSLDGNEKSEVRACIWRFADEPRALRVTLAPMGEDPVAGWVWVLDDISAEEGAVDELRQREERFRLFFQSLQQDAVVYTDLDGRLLEWNEPFQRLVGYPADTLAGMTMGGLTSPAWGREKAARIADEVRCQGYSSQHEKEIVRADGKIVPVEARSFIRKDEAGRPTAVWEMLRDISARKSAEAQLLLAAQAFDRARDGVILTTPEFSVVTVNDTFLAMSGYPRDELLGHPIEHLGSSRQDEGFYRALRESLARDGWWQGEIWQRRRDGELFLKWLVLNGLKDDAGQVTHYLWMFRDAEAVRIAHTRLEFLATHDELTGLPNRTLFDDRFHLALAHAARSGRFLALLVVNLDEFKQINDSFGHKTGDALLVEAAGRLKRVLSPEDTLARWGGDEFAVLVDTATMEEVAGLSLRILAAHGELYRFEGFQAQVSVSVGISVYPADGADPATLVRKAETALHRAKSQGKNTYRFFTDDMAQSVSRQLRMESELRQAAPRGELFLLYQPQLHSSGGWLAGCEALLRWRHGDQLLSPGRFIPVAEKSNLIVDLTEWVLAETCRQIVAWDAGGFHVETVSVNMSARHFLLDALPRRLGCILAEVGVRPERICLEITEGLLMDPGRCEAVLRELRVDGFHVSVDDFGTGFSSLSYLKRFPVDELKIDKSFVDGIESSETDRAIISATVAMAHSLGMRVVAEGVETRGQQAFLQRERCDVLQGYLFDAALLPERLDDCYRPGAVRQVSGRN